MVEAPTASGNAKPQSARASRKKTLAAAAAEEGINDATQSSGKTEGGQGKRPARERNTGKGTREDAKRHRMDAAQGTAEKEVQTDHVAISAAAQPDISHYECPICISIIIAPVVSPCGHDFCQHCYEGMMATPGSRFPGNLKCPICREAMPSKVPGVCKRLESTVELLFPQQLTARRALLADELEERNKDRERAKEAQRAQRGGGIAMAEVFETLHHITREARDRLAAVGTMYEPDGEAGAQASAAHSAPGSVAWGMGGMQMSAFRRPVSMALRAGNQTQAAPRQQQSGAQAAEAPRENVAAPPAPGDDGPWLPWGHLHPQTGGWMNQASPVSWGQPGASTEPSPAAQGGAQLPFSWAANTAPMPQPTLEAPASGPVPEDQQNSIAQSFRGLAALASRVVMFHQAMHAGGEDEDAAASQMYAELLNAQRVAEGMQFPMPAGVGGGGEGGAGPPSGSLGLPTFTMGRVEDRPRNRRQRRRAQNLPSPSFLARNMPPSGGVEE
ncbi:hypothetical protein COCSUDRAFT_59869 [Coccomyxa subellipsoidea C-169]|uniref:RING-type domain-containing protein n=1 Tax=Coccomyxa subellipsoidea (strain C-169) TaxID=574566 RepID=I0YKM5_COCSC|nr:hypothetical protein COCSUDRAFT_59869 [Coccomyxa subellipsoidea C-169]EIE18944.1 hypothetical protein COCSUDRAFT_59869 [Coccomyxa subellipsoidea C-169]|eukprot:XP_005643488.1 hypothetical protein COCSUDRAFT_59869 [Coccomyxa subellipsoidea C-169]